MINVYQPSLGEEELEEIRRVFKSNWLGKGKLVSRFEENYARHIRVNKEHVISTNCCTEGLFSSMKMFDIGRDDEVIVPTISFVGAANAVCANGSKLVLCDVDKRTLNARAEDIEKVITPKTKAILLLHYGGIPCDMDSIMRLAEENHLIVIEDCAAGVCSTYHGKDLGTIGDMGMWSFDAMKILVCGDGAMLYFRDLEIREKCEKWLYFGLETKSGYENNVGQKWWEFDISSFGHRAIMNDVSAAMALVQLNKLPSFIKRRKEINDYYDENLSKYEWMDLPLPLEKECNSSYYFYHVQIKNGKRDQLAAYLRENGVYTTYRYYPLHRVKRYGLFGSYPGADYAADTTLCLPIHQSMKNEDLDYIISLVDTFRG